MKQQHTYTDEQRQFILDHSQGRTATQLANLMSEQFGISFTKTQIKSYRGRYKIPGTIICYSSEQKQFILDHHYGLTAPQLAELMSWYFEETFTATAIRSYKNRHKIYSGSVVPRKRQKFGDGWPPTQFKKGEKPFNYLPIGSERVNSDGYHQVKTKDGQKKWSYKHVLIWEQHHGKVPNGHVVIFGDGDKNNLDINNLVLVSRAQLAMLNKHSLIKNDADLTRVGVALVDLKRKIWEAQKP